MNICGTELRLVVSIIKLRAAGSVSTLTSLYAAPRDLRKFLAATQYGQTAVVYMMTSGTQISFDATLMGSARNILQGPGSELDPS